MICLIETVDIEDTVDSNSEPFWGSGFHVSVLLGLAGGKNFFLIREIFVELI
jgi:hypothetical protein